MVTIPELVAGMITGVQPVRSLPYSATTRLADSRDGGSCGAFADEHDSP
jgi:hypothetical protein